MVQRGTRIPGSRPSRLRLAELAVIAVLILTLIGVVIQKVWETRVAAERVAVLQTIGALRAALGITVATRTARGGLAALGPLHRSNPLDLLDKPPSGYLGEKDDPDPATIGGYHWYFDRRERVLVYRVANSGRFEGGPPGPARIRLQLRTSFADRNGNGRYDPASERIDGIRLVVLDDYRWRSP
ncbi:MAG TPA: hypothetical protein VKA64_05805 [Gammaproteobacteria bacterium]|nr:hypothetical protein [Gammaproteobacteria bacterium]